jgi:hypothetical protein
MQVRFPADVKEWLANEAARNLRSMNQEIVKSLRDRMAHEKAN